MKNPTDTAPGPHTTVCPTRRLRRRRGQGLWRCMNFCGAHVIGEGQLCYQCRLDAQHRAEQQQLDEEQLRQEEQAHAAS